MNDITQIAGHVEHFPYAYSPQWGHASIHRYEYFPSLEAAKKWFNDEKKSAMVVEIYESGKMVDSFTAPEDVIAQRTAGASLIESETI